MPPLGKGIRRHSIVLFVHKDIDFAAQIKIFSRIPIKSHQQRVVIIAVYLQFQFIVIGIVHFSGF